VIVNPCKNVERHKVTSRERVLSDGELPLFWSAFDKAGLQGVALKLILLLGQRPGEVLHMRSEHIIDQCWWNMPGKPEPKVGWPGTKNGHSHKVYLPTMVQEMLVELNDDGFVLAGRGGRKPIARLDDAMRNICTALGVGSKVTPHDLRRTHGTKITKLGFGRDAMNRIQNHKEGGVTDTYDRHGYADENKRVMEAVASQLMAIVAGKGGDDNVVQMPSRKKSG
jgi:integrase